MIGQTLSHYRIVDKLGAGGMGEVYLAEDTRLKRRVALKVLPAERAQEADRRQRFQREAEAVAALNHPHIVTLYSIEECEGVRFLTMEHVEGTTLDKLIPKSGLSLEELIEIALPLVDALAAAHDRGIVHRDLKPGNVMITRDGRLKVLDFGLAKLLAKGPPASDLEAPTESLTKAGVIFGTLPYMAPEQVEGRIADPRSDLFSVGIILYQMATGELPFHGDNPARVITSILRDTPPPLAEVRTDLPRDLGRIVARCLEKDPARRYQSARDLKLDLEELAGGVATRAFAPSLPAPVPSVRRSRRWTSVAAVLGVLLAAALVAVLLALRHPAVHARYETLAVVPVSNLTGDAKLDYLGESITMGLLTHLHELSTIRLIESDAERRGTRAAPRAPEADARLEGEMHREGGRLRVDVRLTDTGTGLVLWTRSFAEPPEGLSPLAQAIAREVAMLLSLGLSPREMQSVAHEGSRLLPAYELVFRGYHLLETGDPRDADTAAEVFRQALRIAPKLALAHVGLSEAAWTLYESEKRPETLAEAEAEARRALAIEPDLPAAQVALARVFRSTSRYDQAIDELQAVLAKHPRPAEAQREMARSFERVGDFDEAQRCLRTATALDPDDWRNWQALGALLHHLGRYEEAADAFRTSARLVPPDVIVPFSDLVAQWIQQGKFEEAIEAGERVPQPIRDPALASNIGTAYYYSHRQDRWEKAASYYRLATRLNPRSPALHRNLGDLLDEIGKHEEAQEHFRTALSLVEEELASDPKNLDLQLTRALYAAKAKSCGTALPAAQELEAAMPPTAESTHRLAYVWALCDRADSALDTLRRAIELGYPADIIRREPEFDSLRKRPDFVALTRSRPSH